MTLNKTTKRKVCNRPILVELEEVLNNLGFDDRKKIMAIEYIVWEKKQNTPLTKKQKEVLLLIGEYTKDHGYAPTLEEITKGMGLKTISTAHEHVRVLEQKGYLSKTKGDPRGIKVL